MPLDGTTPTTKPFKTISGGKKDNRSRKERRKETGEDFTPIALVNEILDKLPAEVWLDSEKTWFDPACGNGNFLVEVKRRLMEAGHSEENVLGRIYGIDIMKDNVIETCRRLGIAYNPYSRDCAVSETILCANTLEHSTPEKMNILFRKARANFRQWQYKNSKK